MKTVFFDVDTQLDFLYPSGALAVPGAPEIVKALTELTRFAAANHIQIISTADAHTENDPEFQTWKPHCITGTTGQRKASGTLLDQPLVLGTGPRALDTIRPQIIIEKQAIDCFTNPNLRPLLDMLKADRYVVYGVVTEYCVRCAAFGLLRTGAQAELVTDAIKSLSPANEREILQQFQAQGGRLVKMKDFADARN
ncbi:MAG: isochorismatase family cysteine hydrolase [Bryobacteraceae bacterium]